MRTPSSLTLLMAEDDPEDRLLARRAIETASRECDLRFVEDGEALLDYLERTTGTAGEHPRPALILLDLNMPRKDGREVLRELKGDPRYRRIPVIVLTTSSADTDVRQSYELGANSYIVKPTSPARLTDVIRDLWSYWFQTVVLPDGD